ncbi:hypothetical protein J2792_003414 [Novosphingobium capsulatum]|uniref:DUF5672 domain-containing protein n=1 Tax=Novosphingobium capsulatum TaxID=13688 RepID=A0ABU1MQB4_9SPHN|nr:DUF5672 family protein [Novosphingobium capsulatum]MDR6512529.1 hypothetical protein [Novosphingobium capsulatum]
MPPRDKLYLPEVTLCAATSVNVAATVSALRASLDQVAVADCVLLTDADVDPGDSRIRVARIAPLRSSAAYSDFILTKLLDHVSTSHCLVTQWDGHVLDARRWQPAFLDFDYIGASWPQFADGHDVGNGGFSLRSRRLMEACRNWNFQAIHPEDIAIGRVNRPWLEDQGMRFAPRALADLFSAERTGDSNSTFGYHGVFNMPRALGVPAFWEIYRTLDDRSTIKTDFWPILRAVGTGKGGVGRMLRMMRDCMGAAPHG